jgi:hypothetical protein
MTGDDKDENISNDRESRRSVGCSVSSLSGRYRKVEINTKGGTRKHNMYIAPHQTTNLLELPLLLESNKVINTVVCMDAT